MDEWQRLIAPDAEDECLEYDDSLVRYGYRLTEESDDLRQPAFYGFVAEGSREFLVAAYFNEPEMLGEVLQTWRSIRKSH